MMPEAARTIVREIQRHSRQKSGDVGLEEKLSVAVDRLRTTTNVEAVILFGSRARGDHSPDSGWDICVILPDDVPAGSLNALELGDLVRDLGMGIQVYPLRKKVFLKKLKDVVSVSHDIFHDGIVLSGDEGLVDRRPFI